MSGIACIFHADGRPADPEMIRRMTAAMDYRGPDGIAHWNHGAVALGHCQLHSTTESLEESQPLASEEQRLVLVMDGYLANCDELRAELLQHGVHLRDRSDAELVLRAYETWGDDCPRHIDGEYAFVIYNAGRSELFCARDHQGLRPLLYHWDGKTFIAASDVAAILAVLPAQPSLNHGFLAEYLTGQFYTRDETVWNGIVRLEAAHSMVVGRGGPAISRYWTLPTRVTLDFKRDEDYFDHYRLLLEDCLRRAARSHLPVAFEASGGLDSSALFCLGKAMSDKGLLPAPDIKGYTLAGPPGTDADEIDFARAAGQQTGLPIRELPLFMPGLGWFEQQAHMALDLPPVPNTAMCLLMDQAVAADGCRVNINGLGGDQWLSGSAFYYLQAIQSGNLVRLARSIRRDISDRGWRPTWRMVAYSGIVPALPAGIRSGLRSAFRMIRGKRHRADPDNSWLSPAMQAELARRKERFLGELPDSPIDRQKHLRMSDPYLASMFDSNNRQFSACGFDMRHPMLARTFAEFSATTPEHFRRRGKRDKYAHRESLIGILPDKIRNRPSKAEFSVTFFALDEAIGRVIADGLHPGFQEVADPAGAKTTYDSYCNAAIDRKITHDVWGIYVVNLIASLRGPECDTTRN